MTNKEVKIIMGSGEEVIISSHDKEHITLAVESTDNTSLAVEINTEELDTLIATLQFIKKEIEK